MRLKKKYNLEAVCDPVLAGQHSESVIMAAELAFNQDDHWPAI